MGLFSATDLSLEAATVEFSHVFIPGEELLAAFRTVRDTMLLTDLRIVYVNVQGITGSKKDFQSIPWRSVVRFSIETAGTFDIDADMKLWVAGAAGPIEAKVSRNSDPQAIQRIMAERTLAKR